MTLAETSEAKGTAQEQPVEQQTSPTPASETQTAAQEQPEQSAGATGELSQDEIIRRRVQSEADKRVHAERLRWEKEQADREQNARIAQMEPEELGNYVKQQQLIQEQSQGVLRDTLSKTFVALQEQAIGAITDAKVKQSITERAEAGEFKTFQDFLAAVTEAEIQHREAKIQAKLEKTIREAVQKELSAQDAEDGGPVLGTGLPMTRVDVDALPSRAKIRMGLEEAARKAKK